MTKPKLQRIVQAGRKIVPRGWAPLIKGLAGVSPSLQSYCATMGQVDHLHLDLRESMCLGYLFFEGLPHERGTERLLRQVLKPGDTFIDVGANVGYYTRVASLLVGDSGRVFAFEPMPAALRLLQKNIEDLTNVAIEPTALSDHPGTETFYLRDHGDTSSLVPGTVGSPIQVNVTTLDSRLAPERDLRRVDFIKIDVEGSELDVLRGATETIKRFQPIVYFEFLPEYAAQYGFAYSDFVNFFSQFRYTLKWIKHDGGESDLYSSEPSTYVVALPEHRMKPAQGN